MWSAWIQTWTGLLQSTEYDRPTHPGSYAASLTFVLIEHLLTATGTGWYVSKQTMAPKETQKAYLDTIVIQISGRLGSQRYIYIFCYK